MSKLYLECGAGISGDMTVGALIDLGADKEVLTKALESLKTDDFEINISRTVKSGINACDFSVILDEDNRDHDMEYLHGKHTHEEHTHSHGHHRHLSDITDIIDKSDITPNAKRIAKRIFTILAEAEAQAHGVGLEEVHFHEVGAADSIADIVAAAVCVDNLNITEVIIPSLSEGTGYVRCQHGLLPIPVPATANIVKNSGLNLKITDVEGELVTPTGAAIAAALITSDTLPNTFRIDKIGIGAGKRSYSRPSLLRAMLISDESGEDEICKIESSIDDSTGEMLGYVMDKLLENGARDVSYTPIFMKKNRPAYQLNVICAESDAAKIERIIFEETTTIGVRRIALKRSVLERSVKTVVTKYGEITVKVCDIGGKARYYPEYESIVKICREQSAAYYDVYTEAIAKIAQM